MVQDSYRGMWFGTQERMGWIPAPQSGADVSPQSWSNSNVFVNGGAWATTSLGSHRQYQYTWADSSAREVAQIMHSYADGSYGRGLLRFVDPLTYSTNVLPKHFADPSMAADMEMPSMQYEAPALQYVGNVNGYPVNAAFYSKVTNLEEVGGMSAYVPIPQGYTLHLGAKYTTTGSANLYATPVLPGGGDFTPVALTKGSVTDPSRFSETFSGNTYGAVRIWLGKSVTGASTATLYGMSAQLVWDGNLPTTDPTWVGGQGNNGVRFLGKPTYIEYNSINGGQVGYAATFIETGSWE